MLLMLWWLRRTVKNVSFSEKFVACNVSDNIVNTHTHTHNRFTALWNLSRTTRVSRYQKKHSPTQQSSWSSIISICFLHLLRSMASSLFNPCALQSFSTISLQVFFGLPLGLVPSTSYSIHFFTQSLSSFRSTWPYHRNLFCCSTNSSLPLNIVNTFYLILASIRWKLSAFHKIQCLVFTGEVDKFIAVWCDVYSGLLKLVHFLIELFKKNQHVAVF